MAHQAFQLDVKNTSLPRFLDVKSKLYFVGGASTGQKKLLISTYKAGITDPVLYVLAKTN
jgi:hypothetical protein